MICVFEGVKIENPQTPKNSVPDTDPRVFWPPGSGSGLTSKRYGSRSISQRHGSSDPDPDPHQNVMDPEHCQKKSSKFLI